MKKIVFVWILLVSICSSFLFAQNTAKFYFEKPSGVERYKLYCNETIYMYVNWWNYNYNSFESYIKFNTWELNILDWWSINSPFTPSVSIWSIWNLYHVQWSFSVTSNNPAKTWIYKLATLTLKSLKNIVNTNLSFVDYNWNNPVYWELYTSDGINLNSPMRDWKDVLGSVGNINLYFKAEPCNSDAKAPVLLNNWIYSWTIKINGKTWIDKNQQLNFVVYDWGWDKTNMHWFKWNGVVDYTWWNNFADYEAAPSDVDNQAWVNSGTIEVRVSCPTCTSSPSRTLTINNGLNTPVVWWWNTSNNRYTWDNKDRWYTVTFNNPFGYEIEKEVTMVVYANDNKWNRFTWSSITFNKKQDPVITLVTPTPLEEKVDNFDAINVPPSNTNPIVIWLSDEWAGIDTWSIEISISYPVLSGDSENEYIMTWYILSNFSESDFDPVSWTPWTGNAWSYNLTFYPLEKFTVNTWITIVVTWSDLAWNTSVKTFKILTMNSCEAYWCSDLFYMRNEWFDLWKLSFTWWVVQITWNRLESWYPRFEKVWEFCDLETWEWCEEILMCGKDWNHVDVLVNGSVAVEWLDWWQYTWSVLYITWLDFEMSGNVIIISD